MAQERHQNHFDNTVLTSPTFKVVQLLIFDEILRAVLAYESNKVDAMSYRKLIHQWSGDYKMVTIRYDGLSILEGSNEHMIIIYFTTSTPRLCKSPNFKIDQGSIWENIPLTESNKTPQTDNDQYVLHRIFWPVIKGL